MEEKRSKAKPKNYNEYPQLQFTTDPETKDSVNSRIEKIKDRYNKKREPGTLAYSKSDVAIEALKIGLEKIEKDMKGR